ncbi:MAG TPA: hypothetical protein VKZ99_07685 [Gammaproteobacteria bacterium]|nr:hypothetical protein [Gammaproteobacteria bacterium]
MAEHGIRDFRLAKRKAAERYGVSERAGFFPTNQEIDAAIGEYRRIFQADTHPGELRRLREAARQAMLLFRDFQPRLVGSVLRGDAGRHSDVQLHLFADTPERVVMHLLDRNIPFESTERRFRSTSGEYQYAPAYRFVAGDIAIEACVFGPADIRQSPASPVDGRPMKRANLAEVEALLESGMQ